MAEGERTEGFEAAAARVLAAHPGFEVWFTVGSPGRASLEAVWSHRERGSGVAGRALRDLLRVADRHGMVFTLVPRWLAYDLEECADDSEADRLHALNERRMSNESLQAWYRRLGFMPTGALDGDHPVMERSPCARGMR